MFSLLNHPLRFAVSRYILRLSDNPTAVALSAVFSLVLLSVPMAAQDASKIAVSSDSIPRPQPISRAEHWEVLNAGLIYPNALLLQKSH